MTRLAIKGRRVTLAPFEPEQITARYIAWLNDPDVNRYSRRHGKTTCEAEARAWLESLVDDERVLAVHVPGFGHVGNVKYGPVDWQGRRADISILIGERELWGQSVGAEAVYLVSRHLFETVGLERVDAGSYNPAFVRLVEKLGWTMHQVADDAIRVDGASFSYTLVSLSASQFSRLERFEPR